MNAASWNHVPLLGFDTETTGVDVRSDRVVSAALVRRDATGTHVRTWLVDPGVEIPQAAGAVHGLTTEHVREHGTAPGPALDAVADEIAAALRGGSALVAYNADFDLAVLDAELVRHGLPTLPERLGGPVRPVLDPMVLDRMADPARAGGRRLVDLCEHHGVTTGLLHTADADALATLDVLERVLASSPALLAATPEDLHDRQRVAVAAWRAAYHARKAAEAAQAVLDALMTVPSPAAVG
ncbi:exonuclease domain-containing protein [Cellulomonas sp. CW35]|uniref:exonuclease domain-containing protein n=1 Tax=unclassified Cellulomonas TaxID=2620175 RepID=UPI000B8D50B2|nr:exonuclease domain-containing protein [Cellulomonas sp. PSBB021]ASR55205.1 DNA polymerase III subunit epsilon [Cellulomonas sp. PSBB021]